MFMSRLEEINNLIHFDGCFYVDRIGLGGGLCRLWKYTVDISVIVYTNNFVDCKITEANKV